MPLDKNRFDTYLKDAPLRDLAFRAFAWTIISMASANFAMTRGLTLIDNLNGLAESFGPLLNSLGVASVFAAIIALAAKDLEHADPSSFGQTTTFGLIGGFFRRIAGDFMLWTLGAMVSILTAATLVYFIVGVKPNEAKVVHIYFVYFLVAIGITAALAYFVRREQAFVSVRFTKSVKVLFSGYVVAIAFLAASLL